MSVRLLNKYKTVLNSEDLYDQIETPSSPNSKDRKSKKALRKQMKFEKSKEISLQRRTDRILGSCKLCFANGWIQQHQILKLGQCAALIIPLKSMLILTLLY